MSEVIVVNLTEDNKICIKNSSGKVIIDPLSVNGIFGCIKDLLQVDKFQCESDEEETK